MGLKITKKLLKSNESISQKFFFGQIPFFALSKMAKNQIFERGKSLKLPEMQFLFIYLTSRVFLPGLKKNLALCALDPNS